jgi:penicillin-binding protein 1C
LIAFCLLVKNFLTGIGAPVYWVLKKIVIFSFLLVIFVERRLLKSLIFCYYLGNSLFKKWRFLVAGSMLLGLAGLGIWIYYGIVTDLPNVNEIYNPPKFSTKVLDRNGVLLYKFYEGENRSWVPLNKIPQSLIWATLSIEDKDFFEHHGLSLKGMLQASYHNILRKNGDQKLRGGSTITQQLVKNVFFTNEKTFSRKIKEAILSIMIENKLTKNEILERYFNQVAYGGETYGVQEAAWKYFKKNVWEIDMAEAAFLAGLPAAPSSYSPFGSNPEYADLRQKHVIEEMVNAGFITKEKAMELNKEAIVISKEEKNILAPHFVFFVKDYLEKRFGYQNFGRRGLVITTTLDINLQTMAERIVKEEVDGVARLNITNGGALIVNPRNGEILAMVGSKDYYSNDIDGKYNVTTAMRQPGSSIKPINYLLALMKGWTLASPIDDSPVVYQISGQKPYAPKNYNGKFMGRVNLRTALASSLNVPSVKILASDGVEDMIDLAELMGITTWKERNRFGLALALGSGEVKMVDLAAAYSIFADMGNKKDVEPIMDIKNYLGEEVYQRKIEEKQIIDPKLAFLINSVLSDNEARAPIFGLNSKLKIDGKTVAVKTGTTNSLKDNWCIGWTPSLLVAAWVGNNDNTPMNWVASGVSGATPIWNRIIRELLAKRDDEKWDVPLGVYKANVCGREEFFIDGTEKSISCPTPKKENENIN